MNKSIISKSDEKKTVVTSYVKEHKMLVNLFIAGAVKGGTTWLYDLLNNSPEVYCSNLKEPQFFNPHYIARKHMTAISCLKQYENRIANAQNEKYLVDGTATYLTTPESPELIKKYNPNAKIIVMLRDPVLRAFSHYLMDLREGVTTSPFIEEGLSINDKYIHFSKYLPGLRQYLNCFGERNVLILPSSDMKSPKDLISVVCNFLSISEFEATNSTTPKNTAAVPKNKLFKQVLANDHVRAFAGKFINQKLREKVKEALVSSEKLAVLSDSEYSLIYDKYFKYDKKEIAKLTGREYW